MENLDFSYTFNMNDVTHRIILSNINSRRFTTTTIDNNFSCITIYCGYKFSCKSTTQLKNYACHLLKTNIVIYMMTHLPFIRLHFLSHNVRNVLSKWRCVLRRHGLALSKYFRPFYFKYIADQRPQYGFCACGECTSVYISS